MISIPLLITLICLWLSIPPTIAPTLILGGGFGWPGFDLACCFSWLFGYRFEATALR